MKLDLRSAYNLVHIQEGDEWKTAFSTTSGHFQYCLMPYGLFCEPNVFQCLINDLLRDMVGHYVITYIDDILIYSPNEESHVEHVKAVLSWLLNNHLYIKAKKCEFLVPQVAFLGYVISIKGVTMDVDKISTVTAWPTPTTVKELQ